ncbi:TlpA disulfide reductase family protein [Polymorphobacter sp.]|uniref:TlpA disulfide reductase family protein n=1 Tax=Polymorphobacter sp. TaxID=1909290 RepID=UPI003F71093F
MRTAALLPLWLLAAPVLAAGVPADGLVGARLDIALADRQGRTVSLADYRGKVVVVTLGGAWCVNCHDEARFLVPWAARRQPQGVAVIGLHFEYPDDPAKAGALVDGFARRYGIGWPLLLAGKPSRAGVAAALGGRGAITSLPTTLIIGRDGRVRHVHAGWTDKISGAMSADAQGALDTVVDRLLAEPG